MNAVQEYSYDGSLAALGHFFCVGLDGPTLSDEEVRMLEELRPRGVILFAKNFLQDVPYEVWLEAYTKLLSDFRMRTAWDKPLVSIDHEGGRVTRAPSPITLFPYAYYWQDRHVEVALAHARELKSLGINLCFAPDADIHSNPANPVIGPRAFGTTPEQVAQRVVEFARVFEQEGLLACAKHFPGHGDTAVDSHFELPVLEHDIESMRQHELVPFKALINSGVPLVVMTAHVLFKNIDASGPATMSKRVLQDVLRKELGFGGPIITDSIAMKAVDAVLRTPKGAAQAFNAGCDIFLPGSSSAGDLALAVEVAAALRSAIEAGEVEPSMLAQSHQRVCELCGRAQQFEVQPLSQAVFDEHAELAKELTPAAEDFAAEFSVPMWPLHRS